MSGETFGVTPQAADASTPWHWDLPLSGDLPSLSDDAVAWFGATSPLSLPTTWPVSPSSSLESTFSPPLAFTSTPSSALAPPFVGMASAQAVPPRRRPTCARKAKSCAALRPKTRERRPFTEVEDQALKRGFEQHGARWSLISRDPAFQHRRSSMDVRDRFRNAFPEAYARAGYKPHKRLSKRAAKKNKEPFLTHHVRPTRSESAARRRASTRSDEAEPLAKTLSAPGSTPSSKASDTPTSNLSFASLTQTSSNGVPNISPSAPSNELLQWVPQNMGPLSMSPTSPSGSSLAVPLSPLSLPELKSATAMSWTVSGLDETSQDSSFASYPTSMLWDPEKTAMLPSIPVRAQTVPFCARFSEPTTPLELPASIAMSPSLLYPEESLAQVLTASPPSMVSDSVQAPNGLSPPSASPHCTPLPASPSISRTGSSVCELPSSTSSDPSVGYFPATEEESQFYSTWIVSP